MTELNAMNSSSEGRRKGVRKRDDGSTEPTSLESGSDSSPGSSCRVPCGACKFLRRKCANGCIFSPHFSQDQGTVLFARVHKVFGASNVSKLLAQLPVHQRQHAAETVLFEAQARLADPVYGCVSIINGLQQQIEILKMELEMVQNQLINHRIMVANALEGSLQQPEPALMHSTGFSFANYNMNMFDCSLHNPANDHQNALQSQLAFDPLQLYQPFRKNEGDNKSESGIR